MAAPPFHVRITLRHPEATVSEVHLQAGEETPVHAHGDAYVVHPRAATTVLKTTFKDGEKHAEEEIAHEPGKPYFVAASEDGITFSLKNIGDGPMLCDKTFIRPK